MFRNPFFTFAVAARMVAGLLAAATLAGCYVYPAGYQPYAGYQAPGAYEAYPYYGGYDGGVFVESGHWRGRPDHFDDRRDDGQHGFHGRPSGFGHPDARPGGFGGAAHGGGFFSHH